jgi:LacI family transcriptional regulator
MATMEDIARETGLSTMTVSRALSKKGYVSERSRKLILEAAKKFDYQVNMLARQLSSNRTYLLGIIVPFKGLLGTYYLGQVLQGMQPPLSGSGYHLALFDSESEDFNDGSKCANLCRQRRVDGLVVVAPGRDDQFPLTFANLNMPLVVIGSLFLQRTINCVDVDNLGTASEVTEYLINMGHTRIGFLRGPAQLRNASEREQGFRKTLAAHGVSAVEKWILQGDYETRKAFHVALELLSKEDRPTAIFAANDLMAYGVLDAARMLGLNVPEDLSVVGFDDLEGSAECVPSLTTAAQPMKRLGQVAAKHLLDMLNTKDTTPPVLHERLPARMVIRASTAPPSPKFRVGGVTPIGQPRVRLN